MKEKLKRFFRKLASWDGLGMLNAGFMLLFVVLSVVDFHPAFMMAAIFHFGNMLLCVRGSIEEKIKESYRMEAEHFERMAFLAIGKWKRYYKLYGELPPDEEEKEKENNQDNQRKEEE